MAPKRRPGAKQSAGKRPPPGSLPPLDPASPTIDEIRLNEAFHHKKLTPKPRKKQTGWKKGERAPGSIQFVKGHTIRPTPEQIRNSKPRPASIIREMFQRAAPDAFRALKEALDDPKLKVTAANSILDRGYGKVVQGVQLELEGNLNTKAINVDMTAEEAARLYQDTIAGALPGIAAGQLTNQTEEEPDQDANASGE